MKKVSILVFALALVFASAAYSKAAGEKTFELTGGINLPTTHPYYLGMVKFAELMKKYSNGTVTMEVFPSAQLGNERDVVEALQLGSVDVTLISAAPLSNFTNDFQLFDFPYIFSSREHAYAVLGSTKPINSLADLKGLKIRSLENEMQVFGYSQWGGNGIAMAFSEVPTSLQNHTLDAVGLTTSVIGVMGLGSNAPYLTKTWHYYAAAPLLMSKATFDQMSEAQQAAVLKAAADARDYQRKESAACDAEWEATMAKNGVTLSVPKSLDEYYDAMVPGTYKAYVGEGKLINADIYAEVKKLGEQYGGDPGTWRP
jgi:TRAP-type C4-dicarboxylate transport system substrate-binding protein